MSYCFLFPLLLLVSILLTIINTYATCFFDHCVGQINPWTFGAALAFCCSGAFISLIPLSCSISDSLSASQSSLLSFGLSQLPFQSRYILVSEILSGELSLSLLADWWSTRLIHRIFNIWVCSPGRFFADRAAGAGDLSDNLNAAAQSRWKFDQDALTTSSVPQMYPTAVIWLFWIQHSFCVAHRYWLLCHITKKSWTLGIMCHVFCSASLFISEWLLVYFVSNAGSSPANNLLLAWTQYLTITLLWRVSPVVYDCLQPITSCPREQLASTPTLCGMIMNMSRATLERLVYFEWISSGWRHQ